MKLRPATGTIALAITAFLGFFLAWPLAHVFARACTDEHGFTLAYLSALATDPVRLQAIGTSLTIAGGVLRGPGTGGGPRRTRGFI